VFQHSAVATGFSVCLVGQFFQVMCGRSKRFGVIELGFFYKPGAFAVSLSLNQQDQNTDLNWYF